MSYKIKSPLPVSEGGTQVTTFTTAYAPICAGVTATGALQVASTGISNSGYVLTSTGSSSLPTFQTPAASSISITGDSGGALSSSSFTFTGGTSGAVFAGSGSTFTESFNYLSLPTTTSTDGQIKINGDRFIHQYGNAASIFMGYRAGNFTTTGQNIAIGYQSGLGLTNATNNIFVGSAAGTAISSGLSNVAIGSPALSVATTDNANIAIGSPSLNNLNGGTGGNVAVGYNSLVAITSGDSNIAIGVRAGEASTSNDSNNIFLNTPATAGLNNTLIIGAATGTGNRQLNKAYICGIDGVNVGNSTVKVVSMASDQLGTVNLAAGTGISITPTANTITIANTGITTLNGNSGSATGSTVTITGGTSGAIFTGSGSTLTESFNFLALPTTTSTDGQIKINGDRWLHSFGDQNNVFVGRVAGNLTLSGTGNTAIGAAAYNAATTGVSNIAIGLSSMQNGAVTGTLNIGIGEQSLLNLTGGNSNLGIGGRALTSVTNSIENIAIGNDALLNTDGTTGQNIGIGISAGSTIVDGYANVAIGKSSLGTVSGTWGISIGHQSGINLTTTDSSNIHINSLGASGDNNTLKIGESTGSGDRQLNKAFISGINGITVTGTAVLVSASDQLGVAVSSARFKDNIEDMNDASSNILKLRPVTFNYNVGDDRSTQTGLIAEEVHDVMPSLVVYDKENLPQTVKYHDLPALLLNELQKAVKRIEQLEAKLEAK